MSFTNRPNSFFVLIDCNNFYASCERVFNPKLNGKPLVILSSNDGCIIARSQEAKKLNIPMGAPFFQWADFFKFHQVEVLSSNFTLYGDLSQRVMQTIDYFYPEKEIYSIDECFLFFEKTSIEKVLELCYQIKKSIYQWVGIPVSIGIAETKTLAKVANYYSKTYFEKKGLFFIDPAIRNEVLAKLPAGKIWGIGFRLEQFLRSQGVKTALELISKNDDWIKKNLSVTGLKTVWELRGTPCIALDQAPSDKKSIICSRSFGKQVTCKSHLDEALATYAARAAEKMRSQSSIAHYIEIFINTSLHRSEPFYGNSARYVFSEPTDYTPQLISAAKQLLNEIYLPNQLYKKAGILLGGLIPSRCFQQDLFAKNQNCSNLYEKKRHLMQILDYANQKFGYDILQYACEGIEKPWKMAQTKRSNAFTTNWNQLLTIQL